jgi:hypothetical protein
MKRGWHLVITLAVVVVGLQSPVQACSCALYRGSEEEQARQSFDSAEAVLVAKIREVSQTVDTTYPDSPVTTEVVRFVVLEVLKGHNEFSAGQPLVTRSTVSRGACGVPARNEPGWIMDVQNGLDVPIRFSDTWLIYAHGMEPLQLSMCTRSLPLNIVNAQRDLAYLRRLLGREPSRPPRWEAGAVLP